MALINILRGLVLNPVLVAFARGVAEGCAFLILYAGADYVMALPDVSPLILAGLPLVIRTGEGIVDKIDPAKQRRRDVLRASPITDEHGNPVVDPTSYANGDFTG